MEEAEQHGAGKEEIKTCLWPGYFQTGDLLCPLNPATFATLFQWREMDVRDRD